MWNVKKLNNNAVYYRNGQYEYIALGKGISYRSKTDNIELYPTDKIFCIKENEDSNYILRLVQDVPLEIYEVTLKIIEMAKRELSYEIADKVFLGLIDHIYSALEREKKGQQLQNLLLWEIKRAYPQEYAVGNEAIKIINQGLSIDIGEQEAGFIALHFVNSKLEGEKYDVNHILEIVNSIIKIVYYNAPHTVDDDSIQYYRFVNHLQYLAQRIISKQDAGDIFPKDNSLYQTVAKQYGEAYKIAAKIREFVEEKYGKYLSDDEILYLMIYIQILIR